MGRADDGLRALFRKYLPPPVWEWTPMETGGTHQGVPDCYWTRRDGHGLHGWVECKRATGWVLGLEPLQVGWLVRHSQAGVACVVAVRVRGAGASAGRGDGLWLLAGAGAGECQAVGLEHAPEHWVLGRWHGPPQTWGWERIGQLLVLGAASPEP